MPNFSKEEARALLKQHLIEKAAQQAERLDIKELSERSTYKHSPLNEEDPENYYYVRVPKEEPGAGCMLDGQSRYILISKITGKVVSDLWTQW